MTKAELMVALEGKFYKVFTPALQQTYDNLKYYLVKVYDKIGDAIRDQNIPFYVEDEGLPSEAAFWSPSEPKPDKIPGVQEKLNGFISAKIEDGTIEAAFAEQIDPVNETAIYKVVMPDLSEKRLFIDRDAGGNLRYRLMA